MAFLASSELYSTDCPTVNCLYRMAATVVVVFLSSWLVLHPGFNIWFQHVQVSIQPSTKEQRDWHVMLSDTAARRLLEYVPMIYVGDDKTSMLISLS